MVDPERTAAARHGAGARTRCRRAARTPGGGDGSGGGGRGGAAAPRSTPPPRKRARTWEHDAVVWVRVLRPTPPPTTLPACLRRLPDGGPMLTHLIEGRAARRAGAVSVGGRGHRSSRAAPRTLPRTPPRASGSAHRPWRAARCAAPAPCPSPCDAVAAQHAVSHRRLLRRTRRLAGRKRLPKVVEGLAPSC